VIYPDEFVVGYFYYRSLVLTRFGNAFYSLFRLDGQFVNSAMTKHTKSEQANGLRRLNKE